MDELENKFKVIYENDNNIELILNNKKRTLLLLEDKILKVTDKILIKYDNEKEACIIEVTDIIIEKIKNITHPLSLLEDQCNNIEEWKNKKIQELKLIDKNFNEDTKIVFIIFKIIKNLKEERLKIAKKIIDNNLDIIKELKTLTEINAGFNNSIFNVNDKYIIKLCNKLENEPSFEIEYNFYKENANNMNIPKLYKYDNNKKIVPYVYEIIEKINGKSIYYHWYKWDEIKRENFIKELVTIIKKLQIKKEVPDNWNTKIKKEVLTYLNKCLNIFSKEEQKLIINSTYNYDFILKDNYYTLIHNDLHFDNILLDEYKNIKIIDFNDSTVSPFDYDLRILFMCQTRPWKWANIEMDPHQKKEDYKNIINYLKKYFKELKKINYLDERMIIYEILNDIKLLPYYPNNKELKNNILEKSKIILNTSIKE